MPMIRAAILAALFLISFGSASHAQDITLSSRDGAVEISGMLLGFDGEFYRVDTVYGELTVDGSGVLCEGPACPHLENYVARLSISGAMGIGQVLLPALLEAFAERSGYDWARDDSEKAVLHYRLSAKESAELAAVFTIRLTNTDEGFADLLANEADIVMALREIRHAESTRARDAGMGNLTLQRRSRVLALDALTPITSPGNPVRTISTPDLARVFAGKIDNWQQLGGPDAAITLHLRDARSGPGQAVTDRLLTPLNLQLAPTAIRHAEDEALAEAVATDPFAIGMINLSSTGNTEKMTLTGSCGFSLSATRRSIKTEDYPLTAPMFLYLPARRLPKLAREFLSWLHSPTAQLVIRRAGFVDQAAEEIPISVQGDRFANAIARAGPEVPLEELQRMIARLSGMARLTTTFRFETGSARLDAQSRSNVEQLARALESGKYDTRELLFVGFSDGEGGAEVNHTIASRRANAVHEAVKSAAKTADFDRLNLEVDAFGEALPMACDDSDWGRQVNRRVEVWIR